MQRFLLAVILATACLTVSCGEKPTAIEDFNTRVVTLPNGKKFRCEVMVHPQDMARGMMFRDSMAPGRGMLFIHREAALYPYWMYQVRIPLDIIWMDRGHRIVEMSIATPPCDKGAASQCPNFGGTAKAQFVLELAGGTAPKEGLKLGDVLDF